MISKYGPYGRINTALYRRAKKKVKDGKVGVYPKIDSKGGLVYFIMHRKMKAMQILCDKYINCPRNFIRLHKKKSYGYFYVRLSEHHAGTWRKVVENFSKSLWENV